MSTPSPSLAATGPAHHALYASLGPPSVAELSQHLSQYPLQAFNFPAIPGLPTTADDACWVPGSGSESCVPRAQACPLDLRSLTISSPRLPTADRRPSPRTSSSHASVPVPVPVPVPFASLLQRSGDPVEIDPDYASALPSSPSPAEDATSPLTADDTMLAIREFLHKRSSSVPTTKLALGPDAWNVMTAQRPRASTMGSLGPYPPRPCVRKAVRMRRPRPKPSTMSSSSSQPSPSSHSLQRPR